MRLVSSHPPAHSCPAPPRCCPAAGRAPSAAPQWPACCSSAARPAPPAPQSGPPEGKAAGQQGGGVGPAAQEACWLWSSCSHARTLRLVHATNKPISFPVAFLTCSCCCVCRRLLVGPTAGGAAPAAPPLAACPVAAAAAELCCARTAAAAGLTGSWGVRATTTGGAGTARRGATASGACACAADGPTAGPCCCRCSSSPSRSATTGCCCCCCDACCCCCCCCCSTAAAPGCGDTPLQKAGRSAGCSCEASASTRAAYSSNVLRCSLRDEGRAAGRHGGGLLQHSQACGGSGSKQGHTACSSVNGTANLLPAAVSRSASCSCSASTYCDAERARRLFEGPVRLLPRPGVAGHLCQCQHTHPPTHPRPAHVVEHGAALPAVHQVRPGGRAAAGDVLAGCQQAAEADLEEQARSRRRQLGRRRRRGRVGGRRHWWRGAVWDPIVLRFQRGLLPLCAAFWGGRRPGAQANGACPRTLDRLASGPRDQCSAPWAHCVCIRAAFLVGLQLLPPQCRL